MRGLVLWLLIGANPLLGMELHPLCQSELVQVGQQRAEQVRGLPVGPRVRKWLSTSEAAEPRQWRQPAMQQALVNSEPLDRLVLVTHIVGAPQYRLAPALAKDASLATVPRLFLTSYFYPLTSVDLSRQATAISVSQAGELPFEAPLIAHEVIVAGGKSAACLACSLRELQTRAWGAGLKELKVNVLADHTYFSSDLTLAEFQAMQPNAYEHHVRDRWNVNDKGSLIEHDPRTFTLDYRDRRTHFNILAEREIGTWLPTDDELAALHFLSPEGMLQTQRLRDQYSDQIFLDLNDESNHRAFIQLNTYERPQIAYFLQEGRLIVTGFSSSHGEIFNRGFIGLLLARLPFVKEVIGPVMSDYSETPFQFLVNQGVEPQVMITEGTERHAVWKLP